MLIRFGEFELDSDRFELRRSGQVVAVEPRVLELVLYLAGRRDRVVSKDELIEQVWRGSFVSESTLSHCVSEARRLLGDSGRKASVIRTVHGRGYQFIAQIDPSTPDVAAPAAAATDQPEPERKRSPQRPMTWWIAIAALLAVAAGWLLWREQRPSDSGPVHLALLPISIEDQDQDLRLMALSIADLLVHRLGTVPGLALRRPDYSAELHQQVSTLAEFAQRSGVSHVLTGSLRGTPEGSGAVLTMELYRVLSLDQVRRTPLGRYSVPSLRDSRDLERFVAIRDNIVDFLVRDALPLLGPRAGEGTTPRNVEAYRLYLLAAERHLPQVCQGETTLTLMRRSVELDPDFAPAWNGIGWAHYALSSLCGRERRHFEQALEAADRALRLAPNMMVAVSLKATVLAESGAVEQSYELLRDSYRRFPGDPDLQMLFFYTLTYAGYLEPARRWLDEMLANQPAYLEYIGMIPNPLLYLGEYDRFIDLLSNESSPIFIFYRALAQVLSGRRPEARETLASVHQWEAGDVFTGLGQILLAALEQDDVTARALLQQMILRRERLGIDDGEFTFKIAQLAALANDPSTALEQLDLAVDQGFFCPACLESDSLLEPIQDRPEFAAILERARARHLAFGRRFGLL
ncbi:MAG TPA: winged helix-turn-helix domain-containing protein [Acidobacteriota bacterium]